MKTGSPAASDNGKPPLHQRPWLIFSGVFVLLFGTLTFVYFSDSSMPDDADLLPILTPGGGEGNPLASFCKNVGEKLYRDSYLQPLAVTELERGHEQEMATYFESRKREWTMVQHLMKTDPAEWRWPTSGGAEARPSRDNMSLASQVSQLWKSHIVVLARSGNEADAVEQALRLAKFGHRLHLVEGTQNHYVKAVGVLNDVVDLLPECMATGKNGVLLHQVQQGLAVLEPMREPLMTATKVDYVHLRDGILAVKAGSLSAADFFGPRPPQPMLFQPCKTLAIDGQAVRHLLHGLGRDWRSGVQAAADARNLFNSIGFLRCLPSREGMWLAMERSRYRSIHTRNAVKVVARIRMAVVMLTLRRYELEHRRLPASLTELVPNFLPVIPLDPCDNLPLRWDRRGLVYSVGENGVDEGGSDDYPSPAHLGENQGPLDIVMRCWWLPK